jgi:quercetin dioxygenase-like cupin family protein
MSTEWSPDDSFLDRNAKGQAAGARRVGSLLRQRGIRTKNRITTSRDRDLAGLRGELKRPGMPAGVEQWQLPVELPLDNVVMFTSRMKAGAVVPEHVHRVWVFRVVITGSLRYTGKTLKAGDWMLVPPGQSYSVKAGPTGCTILYAHCITTPPPPPPPPGPRKG